MTNKTTRSWRGGKCWRFYPVLACIWVTVFFACPVNAQKATEAKSCGVIVIYAGGGAGQVVFDGPLHLAKGLVCADCHESKGLSLALFNKQRGSSDITMRKMELGRSCGYCHEITMRNTLICDTCHRK